MVADALSRKGWQVSEESIPYPSAQLCAISAAQPQWLQEVIRSYEHDQVCKDLIAYLALQPAGIPDYKYLGLNTRKRFILVTVRALELTLWKHCMPQLLADILVSWVALKGLALFSIGL